MNPMTVQLLVIILLAGFFTKIAKYLKLHILLSLKDIYNKFEWLYYLNFLTTREVRWFLITIELFRTFVALLRSKFMFMNVKRMYRKEFSENNTFTWNFIYT